jgi:starch synthase (maltosyl-transferring)
VVEHLTPGLLDALPGRVVIEGVRPEIDGGRFPAKRVIGERLTVEADIFVDGHDALSGVLMYRRADAEGWGEVALEPLVNDRWRASFPVSELGEYVYTLEAWVDPFKSWRRDLEKRVEAGQDVRLDLKIGADLVRQAAARADAEERSGLERGAEVLSRGSPAEAVRLGLDATLARLVGRYPDRSEAARYQRELRVVVEPVRARYGAWYEAFPRSTATVHGKHGSFRDLAAWLPYIAGLGFDVLYLPPIHPIGTTHRKGRNNATTARADDPGSPWAIGSSAGGHTAVHPELGTIEDFRDLVAQAAAHEISIALDIAIQCSPDHPYVKEHPSWFRWRPDGSVQYAENPPKKYEDIYPLNFESEDWQGLWTELRDVFLYWVAQGVRIFRVDNPHTKPLAFWGWLIDSVKRQHPDVIFLAEAFTRPRIMYSLAKLGFSQSYTYFAWRNSAWELREYFTELTQSEVKDYFRPNLWPNTPDILTEYLQFGGRAGFVTRLILAATLGASYGIYGPAFELCESRAREPGSEEYLDSEKYEVRHWDLERPDSLRDLIARVNAVRRANPALHSNESLRFHNVDDGQLLCYSKVSDDGENAILVVVNLDPHHAHSGWVDLDLGALGIEPDQTYQVHDLLTDARYLWRGSRNYVELNPHLISGHVFAVHRRVRRESDFDYFL